MEYSLVQVDPNNDVHTTTVKELVKEYFRWSNAISIEQYEISFNIDAMLEEFIHTLEHYTTTAQGGLYLIEIEGDHVGLGGYHKLNETTAELKRLYLRPEYRGKKIGRSVLEHLISDVKEHGYNRLVLESARYLKAAYHLYEHFGFREIPPYQEAECGKQTQSMLYYMELALDS